MVRYAEGDEILLKYLNHISNDFKCVVGLILGQITAQKYNIVHIAKTPPYQSEQEKAEEKPIKNIKTISEINDSYIADHARQAVAMLPGGMYVLGIFVVSEEDVLNPFNTKLKSILNVIHKTLSAQQYLFGNAENEKLVLQYSPKNQKYFAKSYDVNTSNVQPAEMKFLQKATKLAIFECGYQIDYVYHLKYNETAGPLRKHIKVILDGINKNLESGIILFDNELKDVDEKIEAINKKKKVPRGSSNKIDTNENKSIAISIFEKCEVHNDCGKIEQINIGGQLRIIGEVASKLWLNPKGTFGDAVQAIKEDIMRSLSSRMELHWDSLTEEELGEDINSVHEPPRRVFITLPESNITISDYLFPGEGANDAKVSLEELLDVKPEKDLEILDLEGQADISQYYKDSNPIESESEELLPKMMSDSKLMYIIGFAAAIVILLLSIIVHFYLK